AFATSYIPTTAAAVTRSVDSCQILPANMGFWVSPGGSWSAEFIAQTTPTSGSPRVLGYPGSSNRTPMFIDGGGHAGMYDGGAVGVAGNTITLNTIGKAATTWAPSAGRVCLNGAAVTSSALTIGFGDTAVSGMGIFWTGTASEGLTGYIRRVRYWPRVLSNSELQSVTT